MPELEKKVTTRSNLNTVDNYLDEKKRQLESNYNNSDQDGEHECSNGNLFSSSSSGSVISKSESV